MTRAPKEALMIPHNAGPRSPWQRFRRLMAVMAALAPAAAAVALIVLHGEGVVLRWQFVAALVAGIYGTLLLAGVLMGLVFVSARSGHDDSVKEFDPVSRG